MGGRRGIEFSVAEEERIARQYRMTDITVRELADAHGCGTKKITDILDRAGVSLRGHGTGKRRDAAHAS